MGDLTEMLTNGLYPATRHRVIIPEAEWKQRVARQSIAVFIHPNDDVCNLYFLKNYHPTYTLGTILRIRFRYNASVVIIYNATKT
jgi:hypothetical protein